MLNLRQLSSSFLLTGAVSVLVTQSAWANVAKITGVECNQTDNGIEIILETVNIESLDINEVKTSPDRPNQYWYQIRDVQLDTSIGKCDSIENISISLDSRPSNENSINDIDIVIMVPSSTITIKPPKIERDSDRQILSFNIEETTVIDSSSDSTEASEDNPLRGSWKAEDISIPPFGFIFEKDNKLIVVYQSSSGAFTIEGKYNIGQKTDSYTAIDLTINGRTIETIFQIVDDDGDGSVLSMELMGLEKDEDRPTKITLERERKFEKTEDASSLLY